MKKFILIPTLILSIVSGCQTEEQTNQEEIHDRPAYVHAPPEYIQAPDDIVDLHGDITNIEELYRFVKNVEQRKKDEIRVVTYTTEGAPMLHDLVYDGEEIHSTYDSTRDGYGSGRIEEISCNGIEEVKTDNHTDYVLECGSQGEKGRTILTIED